MHDEVEARDASVIVGEEVTAVEASERTVACCAAETVVMAEEDPATCEMEDSHGQGFEHQEAFHPVPFQAGPCPGASQCSVDDAASGRVGVGCVVGPSAMGPCCFAGWTVVDMPEVASVGLLSVAFVQPCRTGCWA